MRVFAFIAAFIIVAASMQVAPASDQGTAETRYQAAKDQNHGSAGFDRRHRAYRDYVLQSRRDNTDPQGNEQDIAPAAGGEDTSGQTSSDDNATTTQ